MMVRKKINWPFVIRSYFFWVIMPMAALFSFAYALDFIIPEDPESIARREWCKEYHPGKSSAECTRIAGW